MRRILLGLVLLVVAAVALPPLWFAVLPAERPELPPPGRRVPVADGVAVNLVEHGAGPPVVLVHGLPGTAYDWRALTGPLAERGVRAFAYDRVGFGHSDPRPDGDATITRNAQELLGLLESLDLERATVVGWSYGGAAAMRAARRDASRMHGLVLVGSAGPREAFEGHDSEDPPLASILFSRPMLAWLHAVPPAGATLRAAMSREAFSGQPQPDWWARSLAANLGQWHTLMTWRQEGQHFDVEPGPDTQGLDLPILVIHGDDDRFVPMGVARALRDHAERGRLVAVEGGSHMLPVTHPEVVAEEIARFAVQ